MKKTYKIEVDCANCAEKMERAAKKTKGVKFYNKEDKEETRDLTWKDFNLGQDIYIYGKKFRLCKCDKFTQDFYKKQGCPLNPSEEIPEIDYGDKFKNVDFEAMRKQIADSKEYTEVKNGGGHPNRGLKQFLENDRKVLSFDKEFCFDCR